MSEILIHKCDRCGAEQRSTEPKHWTDTFGKAIISFKGVPGSQREYSFETICPSCTTQIEEALVAVLDMKPLYGSKHKWVKA